MSDESVSQVPIHKNEEPMASGIIADLGRLPDDAIVTEQALAKMLSRDPKSIKRAVRRAELPVSVKMLGQQCWTAGILRKHLNLRLEQAAREAQRLAQRFSEHRPS